MLAEARNTIPIPRSGVVEAGRGEGRLDFPALRARIRLPSLQVSRCPRRGSGSSPVTNDVTQIVRELSAGDRKAVDRLLPVLYEELRRLAEAFLTRERPEHTLQPTALVHEAYLRLVDQSVVQVDDRTHFIAVAAQAMRHVLVDHARRRRSKKRGGGHRMISVDTAVLAEIEASAPGVDFLQLHEALDALATENPMTVRIVELRFFGGLTTEETAAVVGTSVSTVEREWRFARAWLRERLK